MLLKKSANTKSRPTLYSVMPAICAGNESDSNTTNDDPVSAVASPCAKPTRICPPPPRRWEPTRRMRRSITKALV